MEILIYTIFFITVVYPINILWLVLGFDKVKNFVISEHEPKTKFTIIVPFRNENENLPKLLYSFSLLDYPVDLFEVILVDDASDFRFQISDFRPERQQTGEAFQITLIDNIRTSNSPKKDAINTAILMAKNKWIVTTDADCIVNPKWLKTFDNYIQKHNPRMIAAGVSYNSTTSFLDAFQQLDFLSLQGTTIGSFGNRNAFMCNGANFCYQKLFFEELNGFDENDAIASGDDVFLLQKAIEKDRSSVCFLKSRSAIVATETEKTWRNLFFQRVRWASKTTNYKSFYAKQIGMTVFLMNLLVLFIVVGFWFVKPIILSLLLIKFCVDFVLLYKTNSFFETRLRYVFLSSFVYPLFSVLVVFYALFGKYEWKGRRFRK
jgi:cellulose synthase/poly-beta-1,6-N-acetylglucosamine synthase-like glycosyltransferase